MDLNSILTSDKGGDPLGGIDFGANFDDEKQEAGPEQQSDLIHIRVQQRNGRKCITTCQGLSDQLDLKKILKAIKKVHCCNGCIVEDEEMGQVLQFQGDQRDAVMAFLVDNGLAEKGKIKKHGHG